MFFWLKEQVTNINRNVDLLMSPLNNNTGLFGEDGGSKEEDKSEGRSWNQEETETQLNKGHKKDQTNFRVMNHSHFFFKMDVKVNQGVDLVYGGV